METFGSEKNFNDEEFYLFLRVLAKAALDPQMSDQNLEYNFRIRSEEFGFNLSRLREFQIFHSTDNDFLLIVLKIMVDNQVNLYNIEQKRWRVRQIYRALISGNQEI